MITDMPKNYRSYSYMLILFMLTLTTLQTWARPGWQKPVDVIQPDGTTVTLLMHGDEFLHFMTTTDGYTVVRGTDGYYRYAQRIDGQLHATDFVANNPEARTAAERSFLSGQQKMLCPDMTPAQQQLREHAATLYTQPLTTGSSQGPRKLFGKRFDYSKFKGLVLLVEFNDRQFLRDDANAFYCDLTSKKDLKGFYDNKGENYTECFGSVRDYFRDNSLGIFDPTFDVVGPLKIDYNATDAKGNNNIYSLIVAALRAANDQVDYKDYDLDGDGAVDMVYFIFAGYGSYMQGNNSDYVWPHASDLSWASRANGLKFDGMRFSRYACSVEFRDLEQSANVHQYLDGIGTMCHEFSHVLGLADHYDTDYEKSGGQTAHPDVWDIMAGGADHDNGFRPVGYNAYERYSLGFADAQPLDVEGTYTLKPFNTENEFYLLTTDTKGEKFYLENRQKQGWDLYLPGHGLLVWRVDSTSNTVWNNNTVNCNPKHMYYELMTAVPSKGISSAFVPFPGQGNVIDFTYDSDPALITWAGTEAILDLYDITESEDGIVTFRAGKDLYDSRIENFEKLNLTTADENGLQGVFCQWDLAKATIEEPADGMGNGSRVVKMQRSGTLTSSAMPKPVRRVTFKLWNGDQQVKVALRYNTGDKWVSVKNSLGQQQTTVNKNSGETVFMFYPAIPKGAQLQVQVLATSTKAAAYVDDLEVMFGEEDLSGIEQLPAANHSSDGAAYNVAGQRVTDGYRGIVIQNGKKTVRK